MGGPRAGDWECPKCGDLNWGKNETCRKCKTKSPFASMMSRTGSYNRPAGEGGKGDKGNKGPREGDWKCPKCNFNQFARNTECFKCKTPKPEETSGGSGKASGSGGQVLGSGGGHVLGGAGCSLSTSSGSSSIQRGPITSWEEAPRQELVSALYKALAGGSSSLGTKELRKFANLLGFDGSPADWAAEYADMCAASGWKPATGADACDFPDFVNKEDSGGYCTDEQLLGFVKELKVPVPSIIVASSSDSAPSRGGGGGGRAREPQDGDWVCQRCKDVQFARNSECRKCHAPKGAGPGGRSRSPVLGGAPRAGTTRTSGGKVTVETL